MNSNGKAVIYLARHGQTVGNSQRMFLHPDKEILNDVGKHQASLLGQHLSPIKFTRVYASTFSRAMETSKIVVSKSENPVENIVFDERLREWEPRKFDGQGYDAAYSLKGQGVSDDHPYKEFVIPGTEQPEEVILRISSFVKDLMASLTRTDQPECILIVSHGFVVRVLMKHLKLSDDFDLMKFEDQLYQMYLKNTGYHKLLIETKALDSKVAESGTLSNSKAFIEFMEIHKDTHLDGLELNTNGSLKSYK